MPGGRRACGKHPSLWHGELGRLTRAGTGSCIPGRAGGWDEETRDDPSKVLLPGKLAGRRRGRMLWCCFTTQQLKPAQFPISRVKPPSPGVSLSVGRMRSLERLPAEHPRAGKQLLSPAGSRRSGAVNPFPIIPDRGSLPALGDAVTKHLKCLDRDAKGCCHTAQGLISRKIRDFHHLQLHLVSV